MTPSIPEEALSILRALHQGPSLLQRVLGNDSSLALIEALQRFSSPEIAPLMCEALIHRSDPVLRQGLRAQSALLQLASAPSIPRLIALAQTGIAQIHLPHERIGWYGLTVKDIERFRSYLPDSTGLIAMATGHRDGRVRQAAVAALATTTAPYAAAALAARLNDWVDQVRDEAQRVIDGVIARNDYPQLLGSIAVLSSLEHRGRADHRPLLARVRSLLSSPSARGSIRDGLDSQDQSVRRYSWETLIAIEPDAPETLRLGLSSLDPWVRLLTARTIRRSVHSLDADAFIRLLASDPLRPVRQEAIETAIAAYGDAAGDRLVPFLLDPSPTLREFARFYLAKWRALDAGSVYREAMRAADRRTLASAIAGLGETGAIQDAPLLRPLRHQQPTGVRVAAYRALDRLLPDTAVDDFLVGLGDTSARVRGAATKALLRRRSSLSAELIEPLLRTGHQVQRRPALALVSVLPLFRRLPILIETRLDPDATIAHLADQHLRHALRHRFSGYITVDAADVDRLARASTHLEAPLREQLIGFIESATGKCAR